MKKIREILILKGQNWLGKQKIQFLLQSFKVNINFDVIHIYICKGSDTIRKNSSKRIGKSKQSFS